MSDEQTTDAGTCGRAAVRAHLIERLAAAQLARSRRVTQADLEAMQGRLVDHLAYMTPDNLMTLAEVVMDNCGGCWPAEVVIMNWARALQAPPPAEKRIVGSWLASVEGPQAEAGGYLVELYAFLRRFGRPPHSWDMAQIKAQAGDNARRRMMIRDRMDRDSASDEDRAWMQAYTAAAADARAIVEAGRAKRSETDGAEGQA